MASIGGSLSVNLKAAGIPKIYNLSAPTAGSEVSQTLSPGVKKLIIKVRSLKANAQYAWSSGESATTFVTIPAGCVETLDNLNLTSATLYIQTDLNNQTVEIHEFT